MLAFVQRVQNKIYVYIYIYVYIKEERETVKWMLLFFFSPKERKRIACFF